jgi:hypothetical protein
MQLGFAHLKVAGVVVFAYVAVVRTQHVCLRATSNRCGLASDLVWQLALGVGLVRFEFGLNFYSHIGARTAKPCSHTKMRYSTVQYSTVKHSTVQ